MYEDPVEVLEESKEEFAEAAKKPGIHLTNPVSHACGMVFANKSTQNIESSGIAQCYAFCSC